MHCRRGRQLLYTLPLLLHSHLHTHTHRHTVTCTARVLTYCCTHTRAHTCLCRAPEIIAYFTEINRISISCTHAEQPHRHVSRPSPANLTSPHLTMPVSVPYRTAAYHSVSHCSSALSLSFSSATCAEVLHSRFTYYNLEWLYFCAAVQYHLYTCHGLLLFCRYAWFLSSCFPWFRLINFPSLYSKKEICTNCWLYL